MRQRSCKEAAMARPSSLSWITALLLASAVLTGCARAELLLRDPLAVNDWDDARCDRLAEDVTYADQNTIVDNPPKMAAKWVSEGRGWPGAACPACPRKPMSKQRLQSQSGSSDRPRCNELRPGQKEDQENGNCEVRPGPEFLLRSYTFHRNGTFRLLQFHYGEESCSLPLYTVSAWGRYKARGRSWLTPAATEAEYSLARVTVTAQSAEVAEELAARVNATCPGQVRRRWRPYREYVVLSVNEDGRGQGGDVQQPRNNLPPSEPGHGQVRLMATSDVDCLSALHAAFHELQLLRTQRRPHGLRSRAASARRQARQDAARAAARRRPLASGPARQLPSHRLPSAAAPRRPARRSLMFRSFSFCLQAHGCDVCHAVSRASERSPPILHARPRLPPYLGGDWVSSRCETRPLGLFLKRRLRVRAAGTGAAAAADSWMSWQGEYEFYSDPFCTTPTFTATEAGRYAVGGPSTQVLGALQADFRVERAALTVLDAGMAASLRADPRCGGGLGLGLAEWQVGVPRDLTATHGCAPLGLVVPAVRYELVRVDMDSWGQSLLYLGQPDTENRRGGPAERPTAYQPPLVRCRGLPPPVPALTPALSLGSLQDALALQDDDDDDESDADVRFAFSSSAPMTASVVLKPAASVSMTERLGRLWRNTNNF
ncbi:Protein APCDD1 [Frankliniella fusca]|uniref:Protein APCDD1 n=1 Tax=Frankliniella fusca TaxID=407009 RepID=A0AAE1GT24_9NEOP|nr:Protein APCDD1 [Frankliniella fusca]